MSDKKRCSVKVYPNEKWGSFYPHQCEKTAVVERNGKWYCKIHDPEYIKVKDAERSRKYEIEHNKRMAEIIASKACIKINPDNPLAVAESIEDMYKALLAIKDSIQSNPNPDKATVTLLFRSAEFLCDEALAKAKRGK